MSKKSFVKIISVILSFLILLTVLPLGVSAADTNAVTPETVQDVTVNEDKTVATETRVRTEEGAGLNTIVVDNGDGTHTMTLYDYPVKYINEKGEVADISLEIASAADGSYKTKANDIQTVFPKVISDGITLSGKGVSVKLTPAAKDTLKDSSAVDSLRMTENTSSQQNNGHSEEQSDEESYSQGSTSVVGEVIAEATVTKLDNETVSYYYNNKTTLEYSLTYTGFKEDIVVSEYTGQTEYHFLLETGGLTLTKIDESYYLTDENGEIKATLGDIIIFTADERNNALGSMTHETVKENEQYIITIHVDADYLKDEKTVYPIRIDPTIEITYEGNGASAIQDVTINQNSGSSGTSGSLYVGKRNTYGISRTLMKFPGLNLGAIASANNITSAYVEIRDLLCETTNMTVYGYIFDGNSWSESTANWSNVDPNSWTEMPNAYVDVNYSNGNAKDPKHRYSIDITQAVKSWKTGFYSQSKGIMLRASDDVEYGSALYKTFASYNRASNKPSLKVNYADEIPPSSIQLNPTTKQLQIGSSFYPQVTILPSNTSNKSVTWSMSNESVVTISETGCITAVNPGTTTVTVKTVKGGLTATCTVTVVRNYTERSQRLKIGMSADSYASNTCSYGSRVCLQAATSFYMYGLGAITDDLDYELTFYNLNDGNDHSVVSATKRDFMSKSFNNIGHSNIDNVDLMLFAGHGTVADGLHFSQGANGYQHSTAPDNHSIDELNFSISEAKFGYGDARTKWVVAYTCNFLKHGQSELKPMMRGCNIVLGYSSKAYIIDLQMENFGKYLKEGEKIITAWQRASSVHSIYGESDATLSAVYVEGAENDTIYRYVADARSYESEIIRFISFEVPINN